MSELEKEEITSRICAMSTEEQVMVCSLLPSEVLAFEIRTRLLMQEKIINDAASALRIV